MLFVGANSAPTSGRIPPIEALAAPGVRIHPAPPTSPYLRGFSTEQAELGRVPVLIRCATAAQKTTVRPIERSLLPNSLLASEAVPSLSNALTG